MNAEAPVSAPDGAGRPENTVGAIGLVPAICEAVTRTDEPFWTAAICSAPVKAVAAGRFGVVMLLKVLSPRPDGSLNLARSCAYAHKAEEMVIDHGGIDNDDHALGSGCVLACATAAIQSADSKCAPGASALLAATAAGSRR